MLLALWCPTAFAQSPEDYELDEDHPFITEVSQLSSPWNAPHEYEGNLAHLIDNDPETYWHTNWNDNSHLHYVQVQLSEPTYDLVAVWFKRRLHNYNSTVECTTNHVTKWSFWGSNDPEAQDADWEKLGECGTPYSSPGETLNTIGFDTKGYQFLRIAGEETNTGNRCWHLGELQIYPAKLAVSDLDAAIHELTDLYFAYEGYQDDFVSNIGTLPGQYPAEYVEAFVNALDAALTIDDRYAELTVEDVRGMIEDIKTTYQAVLDSVIPFTLEDGYYRIRHSCIFINNVPTGEVDADLNPIYEEREVKKFIYTGLEGDKIRAFWNTPADDAQMCPYIWKVTNVDGFYDLFNCGTDARFDIVPADDKVTLSKESTNLIAIDLVHNVDGNPHVTLRVSTQKGTDHTFLHPLSHGIKAETGMGTGTQGYIMGWANDKYGVSEWVFERINDEDAEAAIEAYEPYKNHAVMVANFKLMRDDIKGKLEIAKDLSVAYDEEKPYISTVDQLSSPWCADHDWEGNLAHLIDGDPLTYWHTDWTNNSSWQYLQVALNEPVHELTAMHFTRRKYKYNSSDLSTADHVTVWGVQGSDDPNAEDADWVELASLPTPYQTPGEEMTVAFDTQGKQYLRFYAKETNSGKRYWHCAEFQLYPGEIIDPATSQYHMMGEVAATMDALYSQLKDIDAETVTAEQYTAFKQAYDAFIDAFVDPEALRAKIASAEGADAIITIGDNPGYWKDNSASGVLTKAIADAKAYDEAGIYTKESYEAQVAALDAAVANIKDSANPIETGKWYRIRFGTEEEYAAHNWTTGGNETDYRVINGEATETVINAANFGSYMTVARLEQLPQEDEFGSYTQNFIVPVDADEVVVGNVLYHTDPENIEDPDMALFRFIELGDTAFIIQNKATGLFLQKPVENNDGICLSVHPSLFTQEVAGYGQNALFIKTLSNEAQNPMHFARNRNVVITWGSWGDRDGRRGCFYIEEVEDVAPDYAVNVARIPMIEGGMKPCCYPVTLQAAPDQGGALWTVSAIKRDGAQVTVSLGMLGENKADAGRPFIYVDGGDYDEANDPLPIEFQFDYNVVGEPQNSGALKGVFTRTTLPQGVLTIGAKEMTRTSDTSTTVPTNSAYIAEDEKFPYNAEVEVIFDSDIDDSVESVLKTVAKTGDIYTLDGRLVGRGNLNSLKSLKPGAYIVNGVKVVVK